MSATQKIGRYEVHPAAALLPLMGDDELENLAEQIRQHGQKHAVVLLDGKVLDGRNRLLACERAGVGPMVRVATPEEEADALRFVLTENLHRRHLDGSQRATLATEIIQYQRDLAKGRQSAAAHATNAQLGRGHNEARSAPVRQAEKGKAAAKAAALVGASTRSVEQAERVKKKAPKLFERVRAGEISLKRADREVAKAEAVEKVKAHVWPTGEWPVIVVDPAWPYRQTLESDSARGGLDYPTMSMEEICALPIPAAADCILWLWTTNAHLADGSAAKVLAAWGFEPKTILTWAKSKFGGGHWLRGQTEHVVLATRGAPALSAAAMSISTLLEAPVGKPSEKPDAFYELVERHSPATKRLDMFARKRRRGWDVAGAELPAPLDEELARDFAEQAIREIAPAQKLLPAGEVVDADEAVRQRRHDFSFDYGGPPPADPKACLVWRKTTRGGPAHAFRPGAAALEILCRTVPDGKRFPYPAAPGDVRHHECEVVAKRDGLTDLVEPQCRVCGCQWHNACEPPCSWVVDPATGEPGLCSSCAAKAAGSPLAPKKGWMFTWRQKGKTGEAHAYGAPPDPERSRCGRPGDKRPNVVTSRRAKGGFCASCRRGVDADVRDHGAVDALFKESDDDVPGLANPYGTTGPLCGAIPAFLPDHPCLREAGHDGVHGNGVRTWSPRRDRPSKTASSSVARDADPVAPTSAAEKKLRAAIAAAVAANPANRRTPNALALAEALVLGDPGTAKALMSHVRAKEYVELVVRAEGTASCDVPRCSNRGRWVHLELAHRKSKRAGLTGVGSGSLGWAVRICAVHQTPDGVGAAMTSPRRGKGGKKR